MTYTERFPQTYVQWTFAISAFSAVASLLLFAAMLVQLIRYWGWDQKTLRTTVVFGFLTTWNLRRFLTQALWFHHWRDIPEDRIWAEGLGLLGMIAMGFGWFWEFRHRRPPGS